ncbi:hypothetical protein W97_01029 [Coniosporium apollinis CBS 100218]|uniref:CMP/dCMP-type deaminase domain-containing protein n=1 Tax=Coniosporium apollinis (strain CBS 100218) TaxID=1168221 RepID=R7YIR5_CONA1|nr:uncharacterized protein W97_01029 [Coniosporium apollinis CBS 100218]EON61812.1 hypothetical protein W97_01029 [Coniosporium apollinis CBS 100218]
MNQSTLPVNSAEVTVWTAQDVTDRFALQPSNGRLVPLKTRGEIRASHETSMQYRLIRSIQHVLKTAIEDLSAIDLQHLRRVVKREYLPLHLQCSDNASSIAATLTKPTETRSLLISATSQISLAELEAILSSNPPFLDNVFPLKVKIVPVPALAPISAAQADQWSKEYWPTAYKHTNPFGPHPSIVSRAQAEVEPSAGTWLALADKLAEEAALGMGEQAGCVILERRSEAEGGARVVAAAGDGRWYGVDESENEGPGNVMAHSALRAIGMVAKKRLRSAELQRSEQGLERETVQTVYRRSGSECFDPTKNEDIFYDEAVLGLPIEQEIAASDNLTPNGYLCVDLEIYLTAEPCVMCCMAILHSRFGRVVFRDRMPLTGGMTADVSTDNTHSVRADQEANKQNKESGVESLGYGLFWRPAELNWKMLAWQWLAEDDTANQMEQTIHI